MEKPVVHNVQHLFKQNIVKMNMIISVTVSWKHERIFSVILNQNLTWQRHILQNIVSFEIMTILQFTQFKIGKTIFILFVYGAAITHSKN